MAAERLPKRKIKDILRQKWLLLRSHRQIAQALGVGLGSVTGVLSIVPVHGGADGDARK